MRIFRDAEAKLHGLPDLALSAILVAAAASLLIIAFAAPSTVKAAVIAWVLLP